MEVGSKAGYPANRLTNFAYNRFVLDGVECAGMEGLLQSLKFDKPHVQVEVCKLSGLAAKKRGSARTRTWQKVQTLWWRGEPLDRHGPEYQAVLDRAYRAMFEQSPAFRRALFASGNAVLKHSIGRTRTSETILTVAEFCSRLTALRAELLSDPALVENPFPACHPLH
jgi:hypothetical protein